MNTPSTPLQQQPISRQDPSTSVDSPQLDRHFLCPLTKQLLRHPVRSSQGYIYEREALKDWFTHHDVEPTTQKRLPPQEQRGYPYPLLEEALQLVHQHPPAEPHRSGPHNPFDAIAPSLLKEHLPRCPISLRRMTRPVVTEHFCTYQASSLHTWMQQRYSDPMVDLTCHGAIQFDEPTWYLIQCMRSSAQLDPIHPLPTQPEPWMAAKRRESGYRGYSYIDPYLTGRRVASSINAVPPRQP